MLENGTPPKAVAKNLESAIRLIFPKVEIVELHNVNHARKNMSCYSNAWRNTRSTLSLEE